MAVEQMSATKAQRKYFTDEDDQTLLAYVDQFGENEWSKISKLMGNWSTRQCRERYHHYLRPGIDANPWTPDEDAQLLQLVSKYGTKWSVVKTFFSLRTDVNIKNRYARLTGHAAQSMKRKRAEKKALSMVPIGMIPQNLTNVQLQQSVTMEQLAGNFSNIPKLFPLPDVEKPKVEGPVIASLADYQSFSVETPQEEYGATLFDDLFSPESQENDFDFIF